MSIGKNNLAQAETKDAWCGFNAGRWPRELVERVIGQFCDAGCKVR
jgi:hypothetical protein